MLERSLAGIPFEDKRIPRKDWAAVRDQYPFQALPVLEVDGKPLAQSNTINRYVGKLTGLYPKDDWQAARVDEVMDAIEDINGRIGATFQLEGEAKQKAREALATGPLTRYLQQLEARLKAGGGAAEITTIRTDPRPPEDMNQIPPAVPAPESTAVIPRERKRNAGD